MTKKKDLNPSTAQVNANDARIDRLKEQQRATPPKSTTMKV
jgi:hypothetical protein